MAISSAPRNYRTLIAAAAALLIGALLVLAEILSAEVILRLILQGAGGETAELT